jgi:hypothetical protein
MNNDLQQLKALAAAAAPGPWTWDDKVWDYDPEHQSPWLIDANEAPIIMGRMKCCEADALFIASSSPDTILALIARIESLAADAERKDSVLEQAREALKRFLSYGRVFRHHLNSTDPYDDAEQAIEAIDAAIAKEKA